MIVVYPLTVQQDYTELKFSLRSIEKFLPECEVVIVGDYIPEWLTGVTQIHLPDVPGRKQLSIRRKILAALEYSEEIFFMNDDLFLLKPMTEFYYWHGYLKNYSEAGSKPLEKQLEAMDKPTYHYDGHYPLIYKRNKFKEASEHFTDDCIIKSMYCNYHRVTTSVFAPDCKILRKTKPEDIKKFIEDKPCFSTGVYSLPSALPILENLFPNKSNFEAV